MDPIGELRSLVGPETFSSIPSNIAVVLQQAWGSLRAQLEKVTLELSQVTSEREELRKQLFTTKVERDDIV